MVITPTFENGWSGRRVALGLGQVTVTAAMAMGRPIMDATCSARFDSSWGVGGVGFIGASFSITGFTDFFSSEDAKSLHTFS